MLKYRSFENLTQGSTHLNTLPFLPAFSSAFRIKYCPTLFFSSRNFKGCHKKVQDHFLSTSIICSAYRIPASNSSGNLGFLNWKHESKCGISGEILVVGWTWVRAVGCRWGFSINSNFVYIWWSDSLIVNLEVLFATLLEKLFWGFQWSRGLLNKVPRQCLLVSVISIGMISASDLYPDGNNRRHLPGYSDNICQ